MFERGGAEASWRLEEARRRDNLEERRAKLKMRFNYLRSIAVA